MRAAVVAVLLSGVAVTTACTPEELAWWKAKVEYAHQQQWPCPDAAPLLETFGLPQHFHNVMWRESTCSPWAVSPDGAIGVLQIMPFWLAELCPLGIACTPADLHDPVRNVAAAAYVYRVQGPSAWSQTW